MLPGWPPGGIIRQAAVHPLHDLPHLAVDSAFSLTDGLWAELAAGAHNEAAARHTRRADQSGAGSGQL